MLFNGHLFELLESELYKRKLGGHCLQAFARKEQSVILSILVGALSMKIALRERNVVGVSRANARGFPYRSTVNCAFIDLHYGIFKYFHALDAGQLVLDYTLRVRKFY